MLPGGELYPPPPPHGGSPCHVTVLVWLVFSQPNVFTRWGVNEWQASGLPGNLREKWTKKCTPVVCCWPVHNDQYLIIYAHVELNMANTAICVLQWEIDENGYIPFGCHQNWDYAKCWGRGGGDKVCLGVLGGYSPHWPGLPERGGGTMRDLTMNHLHLTSYRYSTLIYIVQKWNQNFHGGEFRCWIFYLDFWDSNQFLHIRLVCGNPGQKTLKFRYIVFDVVVVLGVPQFGKLNGFEFWLSFQTSNRKTQDLLLFIYTKYIYPYTMFFSKKFFFTKYMFVIGVCLIFLTQWNGTSRIKSWIFPLTRLAFS